MSKRVKIQDGVYSTAVWATATIVFHVSDVELAEFRKTHPRATAADFVRHAKTVMDADYSQIDELGPVVREELVAPQYATRGGR